MHLKTRNAKKENEKVKSSSKPQQTAAAAAGIEISEFSSEKSLQQLEENKYNK